MKNRLDFIKSKPYLRNQLGFSLVELVIVLLIIGILFVGALSSFGSFHHSQYVKKSQNNLINIKKQLLNFVVNHKYLPCPDIDASGYENRGVGSIQVCRSAVGTAPYLDLGLRESDVVDAWGNKIRYAINTDTTVSTTICDKTSAASYFCNAGENVAPWFTFTDTPPMVSNVGSGHYIVCSDLVANCTAASAATASNVIVDLADVILVAYNQDGQDTLANCSMANGATAENCDIDTYYHQVQHTNESSSFFDDDIISISGYEIKSVVLSPIITWNSYTPSGISTASLAATYRAYNLDSGDYISINSMDDPDMIYVDHSITTSLDLGHGDDQVMVGGNLSSNPIYNNSTGVVTDLGGQADLDTGGGNDTVYIVHQANSDISLGRGDDILVLGGDLLAILRADEGDDKIWIQGNVGIGSSLMLGDGSDILWLGERANLVDSGRIDAPINGGSGVDDYDILVLETVAQYSDLTASEINYIEAFELIIFSDNGDGAREYYEFPLSR